MPKDTQKPRKTSGPKPQRHPIVSRPLDESATQALPQIARPISYPFAAIAPEQRACCRRTGAFPPSSSSLQPSRSPLPTPWSRRQKPMPPMSPGAGRTQPASGAAQRGQAGAGAPAFGRRRPPTSRFQPARPPLPSGNARFIGLCFAERTRRSAGGPGLVRKPDHRRTPRHGLSARILARRRQRLPDDRCHHHQTLPARLLQKHPLQRAGRHQAHLPGPGAPVGARSAGDQHLAQNRVARRL